MDPISLVLIPLLTQVLRNIEQAQIAWNQTPEGSLRTERYERLVKLERLFDPLLNSLTGLVRQLEAPKLEAPQ